MDSEGLNSKALNEALIKEDEVTHLEFPLLHIFKSILLKIA